MANEAARARAGETFMDANCVGWPEKIDADRLDLGCCFDCVFGQAFDEHYLNVRAKLGLTVHQCAALGFCSEVQAELPLAAYTRLSPEAKAVVREQVTAEYAALHSAWIVERDARLTATEETRDSWLARINAHLPIGEWIDESELSPIDYSGGGGL